MMIYRRENNVKIDRIKIIWICMALGCALFLMLHNLTHSALWGDEWVEYYFSQASIQNGDLYQNIIHTYQPPLYNILMHFWLKISTSVWWFRFFNVPLGMGCSILLLCTLTKLCNWKTGVIAVLSLSMCYRWIYCIQECSEYALMLFFLFVALTLYVDCSLHFCYGKMCLFLLANIAAIYSQYGSVFVAFPLMGLFLLQQLREKSRKHRHKRGILISSYLLFTSLFGIPLYVFFLRHQMAGNEIGGNTLSFTLSMLLDLPLQFGQIIGYFVNLLQTDGWRMFWNLCSIAFFMIQIFTIPIFHAAANQSKGIEPTHGKLPNKMKLARSFSLLFFLSYVSHFLLVKLHIYAMVHPGQSAGFETRYSYFYLPLLAFAFPILFHTLFHTAENNAYPGKERSSQFHKKILLLFAGAGFLCLFLSFHAVLGNWQKAKDDLYAQIWSAHQGWENPTYLFGCAEYGFHYYTQETANTAIPKPDLVRMKIDLTDLPPRFWLWRTNWGGDGWLEAVNAATAQGYNVTIYDDSGDVGQLAFCEKPKPQP